MTYLVLKNLKVYNVREQGYSLLHKLFKRIKLEVHMSQYLSSNKEDECNYCLSQLMLNSDLPGVESTRS